MPYSRRRGGKDGIKEIRHMAHLQRRNAGVALQRIDIDIVPVRDTA
jgi:hypothetical protein